MLKRLETKNDDIYAFEAIDTLSVKDYDSTLHPLLDKARSEGQKIRFLFYLGPQFTRFTLGAGWEDFKLGFRHIRTFEKIAVVSDLKWVQSTSQFFGAMIPCPVKVYGNEAIDEAQAWLDSGALGLDYHFDTETGVLKVELSQPLTSENIEILTDKVDSWLETHKQLNGLVVHIKEFPGWQDLGSLISHITFIKNHHRKIGKVALCADGNIAEWGPKLASHFVKAKIEHFSFDQLDEAISWAGQPV